MKVTIEVTEQDAIDLNGILNGMFSATEALEEHEAEGHEEMNEAIDVGCEWLKRLLPKTKK